MGKLVDTPGSLHVDTVGGIFVLETVTPKMFYQGESLVIRFTKFVPAEDPFRP
jgi:hypothetical protein